MHACMHAVHMYGYVCICVQKVSAITHHRPRNFDVDFDQQLILPLSQDNWSLYSTHEVWHMCVNVCTCTYKHIHITYMKHGSRGR